MREINYVIKDKLGMHARPAGEFVKKAKEFVSRVTVVKEDNKMEKTVDGKKIIGLMGLGVKQGDDIRIQIEGVDEEEAAVQLKEFLEQNL